MSIPMKIATIFSTVVCIMLVIRWGCIKLRDWLDQDNPVRLPLVDETAQTDSFL